MMLGCCNPRRRSNTYSNSNKRVRGGRGKGKGEGGQRLVFVWVDVSTWYDGGVVTLFSSARSLRAVRAPSLWSFRTIFNATYTHIITHHKTYTYIQVIIITGRVARLLFNLKSGETGSLDHLSYLADHEIACASECCAVC